MTLSLDTNLSAIQGGLSTWAEALRSIGSLVEQVERIQVDQTSSPPALVRMITDFEALRRLGQDWTLGLRPTLVATVPGAIDSYAASFRTHAKTALSALEGKVHPVVARARVRQELAILDSELAAHLEGTRAADAYLRQFMTSLDQTVEAIDTNGRQAVAEVDLDEERLGRILAELNHLIGAASNGKTMVDFLLIGQSSGGSPVVDVLGNLNPATFMVRSWYKIYRLFGGKDPTDQTRRNIEDLRRKRDSMSNEQRRVAGLRLIHRQIAPLVDSGRAAVHASSQIVNFWAVFQTKQESVVRAIAQSAAADVAGLVRMHLNAGARAWEQLAAYARSLKIP